MEQMTITRALSELKLLDKKISKSISNFSWCEANKKSATKVNNLVHKEEYIKETNEKYQSVTDLIERYKKIKSLIVQSNALTKIKVAEEEYTVAAAIERKGSINYEIKLLESLKNQRNQAIKIVNQKNEQVQSQSDILLESMYGKDDIKKRSEDALTIVGNYKKTNEYEIVDPLDIENKIEKLEENIDTFLANVDYVLSESNTINKITL